MTATAAATLLFDAPARTAPAPRPAVALTSVKPQQQALRDVPVTRVAPASKRQSCSLTPAEFVAGAAALTVWVGTAGVGEFSAQPRVFSTGSFGWYLSGKAKVQGLDVQMGINLVVVGSKDGRSMSAEEFMAAATSLPVSLSQPTGQGVTGAPKTFSTGSFGWRCNGKVLAALDGHAVQIQVGGNLVVIGSKG